MKKNQIDILFKRLSNKYPDPKTELNFSNPFTLLVAVVLSAQATDISVNKATNSLFQVADSPEKMLKLGEINLKKHINSIGLFNSKSRNIISLSKILIDKHNSSVPSERLFLEALPGVGRKTASVILNEIFDKPTIAVDTHIFRVSNRMQIAEGKTPIIVEEGLNINVPKKWKKNAHHWLIFHGRYTCIARNPKCNNCIVNDICPFDKKSN